MGMTKMCKKWKRVNLGNDMYSQSLPLNECPFCGLRLIETYNFENTYIYCPKCGNKVIDKDNEMEMMIEESINGVEKRILPIFDNDADHQALVIAIDTMRKYQEIQEIVEHWACCGNPSDSMIAISEVVEDGNGNNHHASNS